MSESFYADGYVTIRQGDDIIVKDAHNKFTNIGLVGILSPLCISTPGSGGGGYTMNTPSANWSMYLGSNISNPTTPVMTALVNPIGAAPGTAPNTKTLAVKSGATDGIWSVTWTCTWTAGTVSGIVGEVALYLSWFQTTTFRWQGGVSTTPLMGNRLSVADNEFTQFTIDNTKPLVIDWKIQFSFS